MRRFELPKTADGVEVMVEAVDDPDANGLNNLYQLYERVNNTWEPSSKIRFKRNNVMFSDGNHSVTEEALLAVVLDRFKKKSNCTNAQILLEKTIDILRGVVPVSSTPDYVVTAGKPPEPKTRKIPRPKKPVRK